MSLLKIEIQGQNIFIRKHIEMMMSQKKKNDDVSC